MRYEKRLPEQAEGALLAHSLHYDRVKLPKGLRLASAEISLLKGAGVGPIMVAVLEDGDVHEEEAAWRIAAPLVGANLEAREAHGGRVNLHATRRGLLVFDPEDVFKLNQIDESLTVATAPVHALVEAGEIVATLKVIPFAAPHRAVLAWEQAAKPWRVAELRALRASLIQTRAGALKASVLEKTMRVTKDRIEALGGALVAQTLTSHATAELAQALQARLSAGDDLVLICGASAVSDRRDVGPSAIVACGGVVDHFGMPVDPGNLMLIGRVGATPVLVLPGCARSPTPNGFDAILRLVFAGEKIQRADIARMGVGGLLHEALWRPAPREQTRASVDQGGTGEGKAKIAAIILAAGRSSRMGAHKPMLDIDGKPLLRHVLDKAKAAGFADIVVVTGHRAEETRALFKGETIRFVVNDRYAEGLSTSLQAGVRALTEDIDAAMIFLGDMPDVDLALISRMVAAFDPAALRSIVVPIRDGRRGHPVLWARAFFPALVERTAGDSGARHLIGEFATCVAEVEADDDGVLTDLDTPDDVLRRQRFSLFDGT
jgi:molybdenum cofactor cytidylyltransferase